MATINLGKVVPEKGVDYFTEADIQEVRQGLQPTINSENTLASDLVSDTNQANKFVTAQDKINWNGKQDRLIAGDNITIDGNVISSTGGGGGGGSGSGVQILSSDDVQELECGWYYVNTNEPPNNLDLHNFKPGGTVTIDLITLFWGYIQIQVLSTIVSSETKKYAIMYGYNYLKHAPSIIKVNVTTNELEEIATLDDLESKMTYTDLTKTSYKYICNKSTDNNYLYSASSTLGVKLVSGIYRAYGLEYTQAGSDTVYQPTPTIYGSASFYLVDQDSKSAIPLQYKSVDGYLPAHLINGTLTQSKIESNENKVTSINRNSTNIQYPSALAVYNAIINNTIPKLTLSYDDPYNAYNDLTNKVVEVTNFYDHNSTQQTQYNDLYFVVDRGTGSVIFKSLRTHMYNEQNPSTTRGLPAIYEITWNISAQFWTVADKTITDNFVGTDGTNAGAQGFVPRPTANDTNKYLKSDGTWAPVQANIDYGTEDMEPGVTELEEGRFYFRYE